MVPSLKFLKLERLLQTGEMKYMLNTIGLNKTADHAYTYTDHLFMEVISDLHPLSACLHLHRSSLHGSDIRSLSSNGLFTLSTQRAEGELRVVKFSSSPQCSRQGSSVAVIRYGLLVPQHGDSLHHRPVFGDMDTLGFRACNQ